MRPSAVSCSTSRASSPPDTDAADRRGAPAAGPRRRDAPARTSVPTPTPPRTPPAPAASAPRASGCAAPSTCSSATGASWSSGSSSPPPTSERQAALDALLPLQRDDFVGIFRAMDGLPVTVRLIDPPLHEFLPSLEELAAKVARRRGHRPRPGPRRGAARRRAPHARAEPDARPARGTARPGHPGPVRDAGAGDRRGRRTRCSAEGGDPRPEIMVPLVGAVQELETVRAEALAVLADVARETGVSRWTR